MCCLHALRIAALYSTPGRLAQRALSLQVRQKAKGKRKKRLLRPLRPLSLSRLPNRRYRRDDANDAIDAFCLTWTPLHGGI